MSIFFEILVRIASYGPQIDQSHGENRLSHIIKGNRVYHESSELIKPSSVESATKCPNVTGSQQPLIITHFKFGRHN